MRELSVAEQSYQAVLAVVAEGRTVTEVAGRWRVNPSTLHRWLARYELEGLEGLGDRSHRPQSCPHQMPAELQAAVLELRRQRSYCGPRSLVLRPQPGRSSASTARSGLSSTPPRSSGTCNWPSQRSTSG
ncbi:MAG: hypothetical protein E6J02_08530 [Chloroflexi bacterium]|nr:MAG: hypothetical protein E6J02_08530 [Chloroflexota bacterium]